MCKAQGTERSVVKDTFRNRHPQDATVAFPAANSYAEKIKPSPGQNIPDEGFKQIFYVILFYCFF
jgi:hypothetical protein